MTQHPEIAIVIATCNPTKLLERTLQSLAECRIPATLRRVIVAENGATSTARGAVEMFQDRLPIEYHFFPNAKKCGALNRSLAELDHELIIFFDDDVRIHPDTLMAYADSAAGRTGGAFFGGRCMVDYEEPPETWLKPYLPAAAKGWSPANQFCELRKPGALGFNWAAFAEDIRAVGNFDERCGPGTDSNGDETNLQQAMLKRGIKGYFVPHAVVWHYVPGERCSPEWALQYKRKNAIGTGIAIANGEWTTRWKQEVGCRAKLAAFRIFTLVAGRWLHRHLIFHCRIKMESLQAKLVGMRMGSRNSPGQKLAAPRTAVVEYFET